MSEVGSLLAGRYRLQRQLGSGAMGVVWLATDERLQRPVAVKQLLAAHGMDAAHAEEARQRAMREGRLAARLHHPNAVAVHDVTEHDGFPVLVMEYLPSRSLAEVLAEQGPMAPEAVANIGSQAASALAAAHTAGIVHRDIKPGNVLLGDDGTVKITDFGISHAADDVAVTKTGILAGTPAFLAPEIAQGHAPTPGSDLFSLGATLYAAVEGTPPFGDDIENSLALLHAVAAGSIRAPQAAGALTPVLLGMLHADPAQRLPPAQTHEALHAVASGRPLPPALDRTIHQSHTQPISPVSAATTRVAPTTAGRRGTRLDAQPVADRSHIPGPQPAIGGSPRRFLILAVAAAAALLLGTLTISQLTTYSEPAAQRSPSTAQAASPAELERVVSDYYAFLPEHSGNAWMRLGPGLRAQDRSQYEQFWATVSDITVFAHPRTTGENTVHVGIEMTMPDGTRVKEFHQLGMLTHQGTPLIDSDTVLHSETSTPPPPPPPAPNPTKNGDKEGKGKEEEGKGEKDKKDEGDKEGKED